MVKKYKLNLYIQLDVRARNEKEAIDKVISRFHINSGRKSLLPSLNYVSVQTAFNSPQKLSASYSWKSLTKK